MSKFWFSNPRTFYNNIGFYVFVPYSHVCYLLQGDATCVQILLTTRDVVCILLSCILVEEFKLKLGKTTQRACPGFTKPMRPPSASHGMTYPSFKSPLVLSPFVYLKNEITSCHNISKIM